MRSRLRKDLAGASKRNRSLIREKRDKGKDKKAGNLRNTKKKEEKRKREEIERKEAGNKINEKERRVEI